MSDTFVKDHISRMLSDHCTEDTVTHIAKVLVKAFDLTPATNFSIEPITSGFSLTAQNFMLTIEQITYVFRLTDLHSNSIDRENEVKAHELMEKKQISPFMVYGNSEEGVIISQFIEDQVPKWTEGFTDQMARNLALKLRSLHEMHPSDELINTTISASGLPNDSRERIQHILATEKGFHLVSATMELLTGLEQLLTKDTLIHHDLHGGNILFDRTNFWFIDLEHLGVGDPYVDMAVICLITSFSNGMPERFLHHYFGRELTEKEEKKIYLAKIISSLRYAISSFSNCENYGSIQQEYVPGTCKFTDFSPEIDGTPDVSTDPGKYWQCIALVKEAINAMANPKFTPVMRELTEHSKKAISLQELLDRDPQWMQKRNSFTILALANCLRTIAAYNPTEETIGNHPSYSTTDLLKKGKKLLIEQGKDAGFLFIEHYHSLEQLLNIFNRKSVSYNELRLTDLLWNSNGITDEFDLQDWRNTTISYELSDLATLVHLLKLSTEQEQLLVLSYFGSRISEADQTYYEVVRQFVALRMLVLEAGRATTAEEYQAIIQKISTEAEHYSDAEANPSNPFKTV